MTPNERQDEEIKALTKERDDWHRAASSHLKALCETQAQVNALTLTWTDEKPSTPGWYWYKRGAVMDVCRVIELHIKVNAFPPGTKWAGPIPEPEEA